MRNDLTNQNRKRLESGGLCVEFICRGDRFGHVVSLDGHAVLESVEGDATEVWPPSPPLQEVHLEARADGATVALAVGRAGRSHWSLSCRAEVGAGRLEFDVACRMYEEPARLNSTYQSHENAEMREFSEGCRIGDLRMCADDEIRVENSTLQLAAKHCPGVLPRTIQWKYVVSVSA